MVMVIKANGEKEPFSVEKARRSCEHAGATPQLAQEIVEVISKKLYENITTQKIKELIYRELYDREKPLAKIYNLREAIAKLDSEIYEFEHYITKLFSYYGYETRWSPRPKPQGFCVEHEIDVFAKKDNKIIFIECKHHLHYHTFTGLDVPMRVWARLEDLKMGYAKGLNNSYDFDGAWVVSNTKFSEHAKDYAKCKGIPLIGWNYPDKSLNYFVETAKAYPLGMVDLSVPQRERLIQKGIVTIKDFFYADRSILISLGFSQEKIKQINSRIEQLLASK